MIDKNITSTPSNPFDRGASSVIVTSVNKSDNAVFCKLVDSDGEVIESNRIFPLDSIPFSLTADEKSLLNGEALSNSWSASLKDKWSFANNGYKYGEPANSWTADEIKQYLSKHSVSFTESEAKSSLLTKAKDKYNE